MSAATVTNTSDAGPGSLRQALLDANASTDARVDVRFNIPGAGVHTIRVTSALPTLTHANFTVDASTQPGYVDHPLIELAPDDPAAVADDDSFFSGLYVNAADASVIGLNVHGFDIGLYFDHADGARVFGNFIGTDPTGTMPMPNGTGVRLSTTRHALVGDIPAPGVVTRNVFSGNSGFGISIGHDDNGPGENVIRGNFIGTDASGAVAVPNGDDGINIFYSTGNVVGGDTRAAANIISGNKGNGVKTGVAGTVIRNNLIGTDVGGAKALANSGRGVAVDDGDATVDDNVISGNGDDGVYVELHAYARIRGNFIGTDITGLKGLGNRGSGVSASSFSGSDIGGTAPGDRNVIAANRDSGVEIAGPSYHNFPPSVLGNYIGVNAAGRPLGNSLDGVAVWSSRSNTTVGDGTAAGANVIAHNKGNGVAVYDGLFDPDEVRFATRILRNSIYANHKLGIDLGGDGVTANDALDRDAGANDLTNAPVLRTAEPTTASGGAAATRVRGKLQARANKTYLVQFFTTGTADPSGRGEGGAFLGERTVTTNANGYVALSVRLPGALAGKFVTATATHTTRGATSEFSTAVRVVPASGAAVAPAAAPKFRTLFATAPINREREGVLD